MLRTVCIFALRGQRQVSTCTDSLKRFARCAARRETLQ